MIVTILGKSEGTITMITDNLESRQDYAKINIVNNLGLEDKAPYQNSYFNYEEVRALDDLKTADIFGTLPSEFIVGAYMPSVKMEILSLYADKLKTEMFLNVIHKSAQISSTANIAYGCIINSLVSIAAHAKIGNHVTINRNASVGHHTIVEDFVSISPAAVICGRCKIGKGAYIGAGAVILDGISIGDNCVIGAGSVVTKNIPSGTVGWGNPFVAKKKNGIVVTAF